MNSNQLYGVVQAASYNIILQIFFRLQTFLLNGFILRYISKDVLGIINVRLLLLYSTIMFLSKEAFRNACLSNTREHKWPKVINLLWFEVPTAATLSIILGYIWIHILQQPQDHVIAYQYQWAVWTIGFCCVLEMGAEPLYIVSRVFLFNKMKVIMESVSVGIRCLTLAIMIYLEPTNAIYGYITGQIICSLVWVGGVYIYFAYYLKKHRKLHKAESKTSKADFPFYSLRDFLPKLIPNEPNIAYEQAVLTWSFFKQGLLKQVLTEGERYVMTLFNVISFAEQGIFDVVNNLGSMAARFIFRPVEESSYQFFAGSVKRDLSINEQNSSDIKLVAQCLEHLLRAMVLLGLTILVFGYSYSYLLLDIYGGKILSGGIGLLLLRCHCFYVLFLAINGITECFAFAAMSKHAVENYNYIMVGISIGFLILSWFLTTMFGSVGFILANCANMFARISFSCSFIQRFFNHSPYSPLRGILPNVLVLFAFGASFLITTISEQYLCCDTGVINIIWHICVGCLCLVCVGLTILYKEKSLIFFFVDLFRSKKTA